MEIFLSSMQKGVKEPGKKEPALDYATQMLLVQRLYQISEKLQNKSATAAIS